MATGILYTIGHSTHTLEEFMRLLRAHAVTRVADVRSIPKSRHCPQFNCETLEQSLPEAGVRYTHLPALGGRRHSRKGSPNTGWRNTSFRGYADYMATPEFAAGLTQLKILAQAEPTTVMCAEATPWRCHRSLIADALLAEGWEVRDILTASPAILHKPTPFLRVVDGRLTYPAPDGQESLPLFAEGEAHDQRT